MPKGISNKRYTPEFKKLVVETMQKEKLSDRETAKQFEIGGHHRIQDWERIYLTEGPEGFSTSSRYVRALYFISSAARRGPYCSASTFFMVPLKSQK